MNGHAPGGDHHGGRCSVVICDDRAEMRHSLRELLAHCPGLIVVGEADDVVSCGASVCLLHPDVLILDVNIPGGGGIEAAKAVKAISPGTKIVAFSGRHEKSVEAAMRAAGTEVFVLKTGRIKLLLDALRSVQHDDELAWHERPN